MNIKNEFKNAQLGDKRLNHRLEYLAEALSKNNGALGFWIVGT